MFADLQQAPQEEQEITPEKPKGKRQDTTLTITGFWGVTNLPLAAGQQPGTFCVLLGLSRQNQNKLMAMPVNGYGQKGENYLESWAWRGFSEGSKCRGVQWQKGIGKEGDLALCKGAGGVIKHALNAVFRNHRDIDFREIRLC